MSIVMKMDQLYYKNSMINTWPALLKKII